MIKKLFSYSNLETFLITVPIMVEEAVAYFLPETWQKANLPMTMLIMLYLFFVMEVDWEWSASEAAMSLAGITIFGTIFGVLGFGLSRMLGMAPALSWGEWQAILSVLPSGAIVFTLIAFLRRLREDVEKQ